MTFDKQSGLNEKKKTHAFMCSDVKCKLPCKFLLNL